MKRSLMITLGALALILVLAACSAAAAEPTEAPVVATEADSVSDEPADESMTEEAADPTEEEADPTEAATEEVTAEAVDEPMTEEAAPIANTKLNLNEASGNDYLNTIPGFSDRMVREFLEYRPYVSIQQFRREIGKYVDEAQVTEWEQYVYVPVDVDESDAATLMQIPGIDQTIADALIAGRPYGSNEAFLTALEAYLSADQIAVAATYLAP